MEADTLRQVNVYNNTVTVYLRNANAQSDQIKREAMALARRFVRANTIAHCATKIAPQPRCRNDGLQRHVLGRTRCSDSDSGSVSSSLLFVDARGCRNTVEAEAAAYSLAATTFTLDATQLAEYRWYHTMLDSAEGAPSRKLLINMDSGQNIVNLG